MGEICQGKGYQEKKEGQENIRQENIPKSVDPMEDMFQKKIDLRNDKVAKNEIKMMKNIVRAKKIEMPRTGFFGPEAVSSNQLLTAVTIAKSSTASIGKFQEQLPKEKEARGLAVKELVPGSKRKLTHLTEVPEKEENLELIKDFLKKRPKLDVEKAISLQKKDEPAEREKQEPVSKKGSKKGKGKSKRRKTGKKPKGGRGERAPGKKSSVGSKSR